MKTELPCVQHLTRETLGEPRCVDFVTQDRISEVMQMHSNLMCAPTVQFAFNETRLLARAKNAVFSFGRATVGRTYAHSFPMYRMSSDFVLNYAAFFPQFPSDQGEINLFYRARSELFR